VNWTRSLSTFVWVFSVGRGVAAFVRTGLNHGFLIDMGACEEFDFASFVKERFVPYLDDYGGRKIAQALLSHPHSDHITQCGQLESGDLYPALLTCPHDKLEEERIDWGRVRNPSGTDGLIETYRGLFEERIPPLQTIRFESRRIAPNLEYGLYYLRPSVCEALHPSDDNRYVNATSIVLYLRHGCHSVLFTGDVTPDGMARILTEGEGLEKRFTVFDAAVHSSHPEWHEKTSDQPRLHDLLQQHGLTALVAPHHGLESGFSEELYHSIRGGKPQLVVISEKDHTGANDGTVDPRYQSCDGAEGMGVSVAGEMQERFSVSTRNGLHLLLEFPGTGAPRAYQSVDPEALLSRMTR